MKLRLLGHPSCFENWSPADLKIKKSANFEICPQQGVVQTELSILDKFVISFNHGSFLISLGQPESMHI